MEKKQPDSTRDPENSPHLLVADWASPTVHGHRPILRWHQLTWVQNAAMKVGRDSRDEMCVEM